MNKKFTGLIIILILILFSLILYFKTSKENIKSQSQQTISTQTEENNNLSSSNIIENVEYSSKDTAGNEYIIKASEGEIDIDNNNIIFLKKVSAAINLKNSNKILIFADFGKYNINNFDTIFSKNIVITYLDKKITSEYLDFSIIRNSMLISKNVVYQDLENTLITDVIEINLKTKDTRFFMYNTKNKINIINQD
tara:strand:- start:166 stop:750 length:585 start_codon:yes stop_codon:yes gene_type:complete